MTTRPVKYTDGTVACPWHHPVREWVRASGNLPHLLDRPAEHLAALRLIEAAERTHRYGMPPVADIAVPAKIIRALAKAELVKLYGTSTRGSASLNIVGRMTLGSMDERDAHRAAVDAALAAGEAVPADVLAEHEPATPIVPTAGDPVP